MWTACLYRVQTKIKCTQEMTIVQVKSKYHSTYTIILTMEKIKQLLYASLLRLRSAVHSIIATFIFHFELCTACLVCAVFFYFIQWINGIFFVLLLLVIITSFFTPIVSSFSIIAVVLGVVVILKVYIRLYSTSIYHGIGKQLEGNIYLILDDFFGQKFFLVANRHLGLSPACAKTWSQSHKIPMIL